MNAPFKDDGHGNYLIGKRNIYISAAVVTAIVFGAVYAASYTVERATSFESTLEWNTKQVAEIILEQKEQGDRLSQIEQTAQLLEYRVDRLDKRISDSRAKRSHVNDTK